MYNLVHGPGIAKDEVNGTFNIAVLEIVAASVVTKSVLGTIEATACEISLIP